MQENGNYFHKGDNFDVSWIPNVDAIMSLITSYSMVFNRNTLNDVTKDVFFVIIMSYLWTLIKMFAYSYI
jgi:hypothetical protein